MSDLIDRQPVAKDINVPVSDCISRQDAIDAIKACDDGHGFVWLDGVRAVLTLLPSLQERKGRWNRISPAKIYECSVCGRQVMTDDIDVYAFCHGCGAKMEGAEE